MPGRVDGETAVVTGAAQGIGEAIARKLGAEGAAVVIADRQAEKAESVAADLRDEGVEALVVDCDVTDRGDTERMAARAEEEFGGVDILVNNAGVGSAGSFEDLEPDAWDLVLDVNLTGPYNCSRAVVPGMVERGHGRIINISSMAGRNISYTARQTTRPRSGGWSGSRSTWPGTWASTGSRSTRSVPARPRPT
jgi:3-oxoacyl-[acyl-carrier protein] reductase